MADFLSQFWNWFIIIPTLLGIAGVVWLTVANTQRKSVGEQTMGHIWDGDLQEYNNPLPRWWLNLLYITIGFSLIYLLLYPGLGSFRGLLGWSQTTQYQDEINAAEEEFGPLYRQYADQPIEELTKNTEAMRTGARLFSNYCTQCHGSDARGAIGFPNLRDQAWQYGGDPQSIKVSILNGRNGVMPGWEQPLGETGVYEVIEYVRSLSGLQADASVLDAGETKFKQFCIACHGPEGHGNPQLGAPDLTDDTWLYGNSRRALTQSVAKGRQGRMPAHGEFLGEARVHLLAAYIYGLSQQQP